MDILKGIERTSRLAVPKYLVDTLIKMQNSCGSHPENPCFISFLEEALDFKRNTLVGHLFDKYIHSIDSQHYRLLEDLIMSTEQRSKDNTERYRLKNVYRFLKMMDMNQVEPSLKRRVLELIVDNLCPDVEDTESSSSYFTVITKFVMDMIPLDDIDLSPFLRDALQRGQSSLVLKLLQKGAPVEEVGPLPRIPFTAGSFRVFQVLHSSGYQFPEVDQLKASVTVGRQYRVEFQTFCVWLSSRQSSEGDVSMSASIMSTNQVNVIEDTEDSVVSSLAEAETPAVSETGSRGASSPQSQSDPMYEVPHWMRQIFTKIGENCMNFTL
jgi:hypothetical protein